MHGLVSVRAPENSQSGVKNKVKNILLTACAGVAAAAAKKKQNSNVPSCYPANVCKSI